MPDDEASRRQGQSLLDGIDAALARNTHSRTTLQTIAGTPAGPVEAREDPTAVENTEPTVGMTEDQMHAQGHQIRRAGLFG